MLWFIVVARVCLFKIVTEIFLIIPILIITVTLIFIITVVFVSEELICWDFTVEMIFNVFQSFKIFPIVLIMKIFVCQFDIRLSHSAHCLNHSLVICRKPSLVFHLGGRFLSIE
jgi:hypothetical protein